MLRFFLLPCFALLPLFIKAQTADSIDIDWLIQQPDSVILEQTDSMTMRVKQLFAESKYSEAAVLTEQQLLILSSSLGKELPAYGRSLGNLGTIYQIMGKYEEALPLLLEALENTKNSLGVAHTSYGIRLNNLGQLYEAMGRYEEALPLHLEALENTRNALGVDHPDYGRGLGNLGTLYRAMGRYEEALPLHLEALEVTRNALGVDHLAYGNRLNNLGILYDVTGRYEEALPLYLEALEIIKSNLGIEHPRYGVSLNNLGLLYFRMGRYKEALTLYLEALGVTKNSLGEEHNYYTISLNNLCDLYKKMGRYKEAALYLIEAYTNLVNQVNKIFSISSEKNKADFLKTLAIDFEHYESFALDTEYRFDSLNELLFNNLLLLNGLILESTTNTFTAIENSSDIMLVNQFKDWQQLRKDLAKQYSIPIAKRTIDIDSLEQVANDLEGELVRQSSDFAETRKQVKWQDVRQALKTNELALEFSSFRYRDALYKTDSILYTAMLVAPNSEVPTIIPLFEQKQLDALLGQSQGKTDEQYISQLYASRGGAGMGSVTDQARAAELYKLIWKPLEEYLDGAERIYFAPSGKLHQIALHALPDENGELMVQQYDMRYVNSTRVLVTGKEPDVSGKSFHAYGGINYDLTDNQWEQAVVQYQSDEPEEEDPLLALGFVVEKEPEYATDARGTDRGNTWNQLNGTATEVNSITNLLDKKDWNTQSYTGGLALEEAIKSNTGELAPDVLHIATHGFFFPDVEDKGEGSVYRQADDPMFRSGLIMAGGNRDWQQQTLPKGVENGVLTAYEVAQLDLRNTDLVVLSACETGLGDVQGSEGVYGLQRAFKQAGADYLIISLWKVPDAQTVELMELFYKYWQKGQSIPQAFRKAQLKMSKKYSPYEWAAFKLVR